MRYFVGSFQFRGISNRRNPTPAHNLNPTSLLYNPRRFGIRELKFGEIKGHHFVPLQKSKESTISVLTIDYSPSSVSVHPDSVIRYTYFLT